MDVFQQAIDDLAAIVSTNWHADAKRLYISRVVANLERVIKADREREPGPLCRTCGQATEGEK